MADAVDRFEKREHKVIVRVAGVCGPTEQAVAEAKLAKQYGYDTVLLSPGGLNHEPEEYLIARTKAVSAVMPVIGFYLQTAVGGRAFTYHYWEEICAISNVAAIKCASFQRY